MNRFKSWWCLPFFTILFST